jgi:hypothetical protein
MGTVPELHPRVASLGTLAFLCRWGQTPHGSVARQEMLALESEGPGDSPRSQRAMLAFGQEPGDSPRSGQEMLALNLRRKWGQSPRHLGIAIIGYRSIAQPAS